MVLATLKDAVRPWAPPSWLERYRRLRMEIPVRLRDAIPDLRERLRPGAGGPPIPPARLRRGVGRTSSRREYLDAGRSAFDELLSAFRDCRDVERDYPTWLDFGCGSGRICRHLEEAAEWRRLVGVDVDADAIAWNRKHLRFGDFLAIDPEPPTPLATGSCDLIFAASVFTHLDEMRQHRWLAELRRLLAPGGLLLASTHSEKLARTRPDLSAAARRQLAGEGFVFASGRGRFNANTAFHARRYLEREWGAYFEPLAFREQGLFAYQDLSVWAAREPRSQIRSL